MAGLQMPKKGQGAQLLRELQDQDRPTPILDEIAHYETNVTTLQPTNETSLEESSVTPKKRTKQRSNDPAHEETNEPTGDAGQEKEHDSSGAVEADERMVAALARAAVDDVAVVTVRAPQKLNDYIDRYVERVNRVHPKQKYRKQDAVAEMFAWFYASHLMPPAPDDEDF